MTDTMLAAALKFLESGEGKPFRNAFASGDTSYKDLLWNRLGYVPMSQDIEDADAASMIRLSQLINQSKSGGFGGSEKSSGPKYTPDEIREFNAANLEDIKNRNKEISNTLAITGPELALEIARSVVSNGARALGNISNSNYTSLARALMASSRQSTDAQKNAYGLNNREKYAQAYADRLAAKGQKHKIIGDAVADTVNQLGGSLASRMMMGSEMAAAKLADLNSGGFNFLNGQAGRAERLRRSYGPHSYGDTL